LLSHINFHQKIKQKEKVQVISQLVHIIHDSFSASESENDKFFYRTFLIVTGEVKAYRERCCHVLHSRSLRGYCIVGVELRDRDLLKFKFNLKYVELRMNRSEWHIFFRINDTNAISLYLKNIRRRVVLRE
jgi:hypothetical protein